jgi:hypothetical protein
MSLRTKSVNLNLIGVIAGGRRECGNLNLIGVIASDRRECGNLIRKKYLFLRDCFAWLAMTNV